MPGLQWFRFDADFWAHPKVMRLVHLPQGRESVLVWVASIGYATKFGTDGRIEPHVLPVIHGQAVDGDNLVAVGLWDADASGGWWVHDFADYQQVSETTERVRENRAEAGRKGNCVRHHGLSCGCWKRNGLRGVL